jgi:hypothetical protein
MRGLRPLRGDIGNGDDFGHYFDCAIFWGESYQYSVPEGCSDYRGNFSVFVSFFLSDFSRTTGTEFLGRFGSLSMFRTSRRGVSQGVPPPPSTGILES